MKKLIYTLFLSSACALAFGQGNHSVDPLTGALTMEVPLFTVTDGDLAFPIVLTYRTNGVQLNAAGGLYGHGWNSTADAAISRDVRSLPDDYLGQSPDTRKGWLHGDMGTRIKNFTINTDNNPATCTDEAVNYTFLNSFGYNEDTEPDVYYVNAPGLSFQFYFDENNLPQVVPLADVQITYTSDPGNSQILSFTVVDSRGYSYVFAAVEKTKEWIKDGFALKDYAFRRKYELYKTACTYATSWKLTQINSPVYGQINLSYRDITLISDPAINQAVSISRAQVEDRYIFKSPVYLTAEWKAKEEVFRYDLVYYQKVLDLISSASHDVDFVAFKKPDQTEVVSNIKIYDKRTTAPSLLKEYKFSYAGPGYYEYTGHSLPVPWDPGYVLIGSRSFLFKIEEKTATTTMPPLTFEYYGTDLPNASTDQKDDWGFFKSISHSQWESMVMGSLKRVLYPTGGYLVAFYESHDYFDIASNTTKRGGGIRVKKTISHDGLSSSSDITEEYDYQKIDGQSSGKLVYKPGFEISTVQLSGEFPYPNGEITSVVMNPRYREVQALVSAGNLTAPAGKYFKLTSAYNPGDYELIGGSVVAYERVVRRRDGAGRSIYEFDLPAMASEVTTPNGEWQASGTLIARPSVSGGCYEIGAIPTGVNTFPYPRNPNYNFARGLLKKVTDENESGIKVRDEEFTYQRVYGGSGIRKLFGLALDELPTYFYNGSYTDAKMFLYGKYEVLTDVKIELSEKKETFYYSNDLTKKNETVTTYQYGSTHHRELTKVIATNSDLTQSIRQLSYVKDYSITSPSGTHASNIVMLKNAHRNEVIETLSSTIKDGVEKYTAGTLVLFQELSTKIYPHQFMTFNSTEGLSAFSRSSVTGGTTFQFDSNYDLKNSITSFSTTALPKEQIGKDRVVQSTVWAFGETLPIMQITNAKLNEIGYSDFESANEVDFSGWATATKSAGRTGATAIVMPGSEAMTISKVINNLSTQQYIFSCWVKAPANGNLTLKLRNGPTDLITPLQIPYQGSGEWKFVSVVAPTSGLPASFTAALTSSGTIEMDEVAIYPSHAQVAFNTYTLPFGVGSTTNMSGRSLFYTYDEWGRVITVHDQDSNIINKRNYHVRPN